MSTSSNFSLKGKVVVYIGGTGGIGIGSCKAFLSRNISNLYVLDRTYNEETIKCFQEINPSTKLSFLPLDITKNDEISRCLEQVICEAHYIDVLVNGAGICDERDVEKEIAINLTGPIQTTIKAFKLMNRNKKGRGGVIVNISSIAGLKPFEAKAVYCATKHGLVGFSRSLGTDFYFKKTGITVLCVCPGLTTSPMTSMDVVTKGTFPYSAEITTDVLKEKPQTVDEMGEMLVKIVEINKNGSIWLCRIGTMEEIFLGMYEEPE